ncbi:hypothetical protein DFH06DRAFT_1204669 [Mycena polygramma]|nr:hypothetical protein DFH06DRAFT_1204669 [Mycena polygramma]
MSARFTVSRLARRSLYTHTPSAPYRYPPHNLNPISDAVSPPKHTFSRTPKSDRKEQNAVFGIAHYLAALNAFVRRPLDSGTPHKRTYTAQGMVYATPRMVYADMRTRRFRGATEAWLLATALRVFVRFEDYTAARVALRAFMKAPGSSEPSLRAYAKAVVLSSFASHLYLERIPRLRHLKQYLLGGFSLLESRTTDLDAANVDDRFSSEESFSIPPWDLRTVEADMRPLVFALLQAQYFRYGIHKDLARQDAQAVEEMENAQVAETRTRALAGRL